jgi:hypothetical protein
MTDARHLAEQIVGTLLPGMFLAGEDVGLAARREREAREVNVVMILPLIESALAAAGDREARLRGALEKLRNQIAGWSKVSIGSIDSHYSGHVSVEDVAQLSAALAALTPQDQE